MFGFSVPGVLLGSGHFFRLVPGYHPAATEADAEYHRMLGKSISSYPNIKNFACALDSRTAEDEFQFDVGVDKLPDAGLIPHYFEQPHRQGCAARGASREAPSD
jgi:hypothetical protein